MKHAFKTTTFLMLVGILPLAWVSFAQPASLTLSALTKPGDVVMDLKSVVMKQIE